MEKIDQLFRNKLENHPVAPSAGAWDKLEAQLVKKNRFVIAWRMAAALLVGGTLVMLLYWSNASEDATLPVMANDVNKKQLAPEQKETAPLAADTNTKAVQPTQQLTTITKKSTVAAVLPKTKTEKIEKVETVEQPLQPETHLMNEANEVTIAALPAAEKPMVIEFVLEEVPAQQATAQVTTEKESGIKKVWGAVKDIKNGDRTIDFRQATQELLASNKKESSKN